ncbi:MAG: DUF1549 domain-containing protein [Saprospiraceae bacterium]|nr:DUF1549 domain-containing protein [Saprospiraceae bacterium]
MGLTLECARCHDHKYDPITQPEYYALSAFFNNNNDAGIVPYDGEASPTVILPDSSAKSRLSELYKQIVVLEDSLKISDQFYADFKQWWQSNSGTAFNHVSQWNGLMADFSFEKEVKMAKYAIHLDKGPKPKPGPKEKPSFTYAYYNTQKSQLDAQNWGHPDDRPQIVEEDTW